MKAHAKPPATSLVVLTDPTKQQYTGFSAAYDYFNDTLFNNALPPCLITLQRHKGAYGYFSPKRFLSDKGASTDEIAMNPLHFTSRAPREVLSTLVHEMCHLWQQHYGKAPKTPYHNKEWGTKMKEVGLHPSSTGKPGGKETGQSISHYIIAGGAFDTVVTEFLNRGFTLYGDVSRDTAKAKKKAASKTKYTCPACEANAWAKPETNLTCGDCDETMVSEGSGD